MKTIASLGGVLLCFSMAAPATGADGARYPTSDEAFYVLACMELNGQNADGLRKCSCAINRSRSQRLTRKGSNRWAITSWEV